MSRAVGALVAAAPLLILLACPPAAWAQVPISSPGNKHNLSVTASGPVRAQAMTEICVFCHTPHNANPAAPLWNHAIASGVTYTPYSSSTMAASPGMPTGSSKMCLSCHDGTVAIGTTLREGIPMTGVDPAGRLTGSASLGTNLSDDHPIAFVPVTSAEIANPPPGDPARLDEHGMLQCRTCHDPHADGVDNVTAKFLVKQNSGSELCLTCHREAYWSSNPSSHFSSTRPYSAAQGAHTGYTTVATNGCESCHKAHTAPGAVRMLKAMEENTCGTAAGAQCHGPSGIASRDIVSEFTKTYRHPTYDVTPSIHDAAESPTSGTHRIPEATTSAPRHAECSDCHDAHASYGATASAPKGSGRLSGVWGVDSNGLAVQPSGTPPSVREYEICYKCHADSPNKAQPSGPYPPYANRQAPQFNKRLQFDPANPSFHPIEAAARNLSPSLMSPWTTGSLLYCTDCHDNDSGPKAPSRGTGPAGPHGSNQKHLLVARYDMDSDRYGESPTTYALCYKCHSRSSILSDASFTRHHLHVVDLGTACSVCHDPHGVSATQGTSSTNSHLINFDRRFVTANSLGLLRFEDQGAYAGRCDLACHGSDHLAFAY